MLSVARQYQGQHASRKETSHLAPHAMGRNLWLSSGRRGCQPQTAGGLIARIPPPHPQPQAAQGEPPPELGRPRHTQLTAGPKRTSSGTSVPAPGATRSRLGNPQGPRTAGYGQPVPTWRRRTLQGWISPTRPPRRPLVTISQPEPVFLGDAQWHSRLLAFR